MNIDNGCVVATVGDLHTNSTLGLCPPYIARHEGGYYTHSMAQRWLWDKWQRFWSSAAGYAQELNLPLVAIFNGDTFDGDHHGTHEIVSRSEITMMDIALGVMEIPLRHADFVFILRGTPSHEGEGAFRAEALARDIGAVTKSDDVHSWWHLYADFGGVTFDIMHVPESGSRVPWGAGGDVNRIAVMLAIEYARTNTLPPQVGIRSHRHGFRDSGKTHPTQVFVLPPWQLRTSYPESIGLGGKVQAVGGLIFICRGGEYTLDSKIYRARRDKPVKLELLEVKKDG